VITLTNLVLYNVYLHISTMDNHFKKKYCIALVLLTWLIIYLFINGIIILKYILVFAYQKHPRSLYRDRRAPLKKNMG